MARIKHPFPPLRLMACASLLALLAACSTTSEDAAQPPPRPSSPQAADVVEEEIVVTGRHISKEPAVGPEASERASAVRQDAYDRASEKREAAVQRTRQVAAEPKQDIAAVPQPSPAPPFSRRHHGEEIISSRPDPTMVFKNYGVNPTVDTREEATTTFSIDVDTAAYSIAKGFLDRGLLPDRDGIRVEEFVNAFDYGYRSPEEGIFSLQAEAFPSPHRPGFHVLHLGVKAKDLSREELKPLTLTFLIDVSGSMGQGNRLEILKEGLYALLDQLNPKDIVTLVVYSDDARLLLEPTEVGYRHKIYEAIASLRPENSTNIGAGIELAYRMANKAYDPERNNRIILCSDGVANVGHLDPDVMMKSISTAAKRGIYLNAVGIGMGNYNDVILEELSRQGQGQYAYVNSLAEVKTVVADKLLSNLQVVARDVRLQVAFDPEVVQSYRLVGYENRGMDNRDFNNAKKDAGEVGAGHAVTAIYEVKFRDSTVKGPFGVFRLNYKMPDGERLNTLEHTLPASVIAASPDKATANAQLSYIAAAFAEKLRGSYWSRTFGYRDLEQWLAKVDAAVADREAARELQGYLVKADRLDHRGDLYTHLVSVDRMSFDHVPVLKD